MRTIFKLAATAAVALGLSTGASVAADPLKVGFIYVGPVSDHGWSYQHDQAVWRLKSTLATKLKRPISKACRKVRMRNVRLSVWHVLVTT